MTPNPTTLGDWLIPASFVLGFAWVIIQMVRSFQRKPSLEAEFCTKAECQECRRTLTGHVENMRSQIGGAITRAEFETFKSQVMLQLGETQAIVTANGKATLEAIYQMRTDLATADERRATRIHDRLNEAERELHILQGQVSRDDSA